MTVEEFEYEYAERSGITVDELRTYLTIRPCACGDEGCEGWQSISNERAREYDLAVENDLIDAWDGLQYIAKAIHDGYLNGVQDDDLDRAVHQTLDAAGALVAVLKAKSAIGPRATVRETVA